MHGRIRQQPQLPWQGSTPASAQSSYEAATFAARTADADCATLLAYLVSRGPWGATDAEVERALGRAWPANIVTARRNDLVLQGLVVNPVPLARARRRSVKTPALKVTVWMASQFARGL